MKKKGKTLAEEHDTVKHVSRNSDDEDYAIDVAVDDVVYGGESLKGDDVVGVVPWNKTVHVTISFAVTVVDLKIDYRLHCIDTLA